MSAYIGSSKNLKDLKDKAHTEITFIVQGYLAHKKTPALLGPP